MKRLILVFDESKADELKEMGFKYRVELMNINGEEKEVYVFIENDELNKILKDKTKFSKKEYAYTKKMNFIS